MGRWIGIIDRRVKIGIDIVGLSADQQSHRTAHSETVLIGKRGAAGQQRGFVMHGLGQRGKVRSLPWQQGGPRDDGLTSRVREHRLVISENDAIT
jgi:hypothetical protein